MAQSADQSINAGLSGLAVRNGINENLAALFSSNSGPSAPSPTVGGMLWLDTSVATPVLRLRNYANTEWLFVVTSAVRPDGLIAQGTLSGSQLIVEIPADFEGVELAYWGYLPSTSGQIMRLTIGSGTIGTPVWGANHVEQAMSLTATTPAYVNTVSGGSVSASLVQNNTQPAGHGNFRMSGFNSVGAVVGQSFRAGVNLTPAREMSTGSMAEETAVSHTLIRLSVAAGTMAGNYRITGARKP